MTASLLTRLKHLEAVRGSNSDIDAMSDAEALTELLRLVLKKSYLHAGRAAAEIDRVCTMPDSWLVNALREAAEWCPDAAELLGKLRDAGLLPG